MNNPYTAKTLTIDHIRAVTAKAVAQTLKANGEIPPLFTCYGRDRIVALVASQLANDAVKDQFASTLRTMCIAEDAFAAVLVAESWASFACSAKTGVRPSLAPDRQECVMVRIELLGNRGEMNLYPIIRDANAKPSLGACISQPIHNCGDRFANLLPATPPSEAEKIIASTFLQRNGIMVRFEPNQGN